MKNIVLISCLCFIATSYAQFNESYMDKSIRPQDDLYNYVSGNWMKTTVIPDDKVRWGSYEELREKSDEVCLAILKNLITKEYKVGTDEQKIKDFYQSIMDVKSRDKEGLGPLIAYFDTIDFIHSQEDLQRYIERMTVEGRNPFFAPYVSNHMKNSNVYALYLGSASLSLGRDYYQKNDPKSTEMLAKYKDYIQRLLQVISPKSTNTFMAGEILEFEKSLASNMLTVENLRNPDNRYNPVSRDDLARMIVYFDMKQYFEKLKLNVDTVILPEINYFRNLDKMLSSTNDEFLQSYLKFKILDNAMQLLSSDLDSVQFDFYGKILSGQQQQRTKEKRALATINGTYGEILGKLYIQKNFPPEAKSNVNELVKYVRESFGQHIDHLQWMSATTKLKAREKLAKITVKMGYPDKWKDYSKAVVLSPKKGGNYFLNQRAFNMWRFEDNISKLGKPVDRTEWGMNPQTVNAYYSSNNNEIVFPAAILQPPFFDYKTNPSVNFGGIGGVIGHEITHGFDDGGSKFDGDGNLNNWWTKEDREQFEKSTQALANQYSKYEPLPGVFVNGKFTLGENIADLGGLSVAYDAMMRYYRDKDLTMSTTQKQNFFQSWATIWRNKIRDKELINRVKTDPHAPGYYRAIGPTIHVRGYYEAFGVKNGDKMYLPESERIIIW